MSTVIEGVLPPSTAERSAALLARVPDQLYINGQWVAGTGERILLEMGKSIAEANGDVSHGGELLRWFSEEAVRISGRYGANPEGTGTMVVTHRPVGPRYRITPTFGCAS
ncbi:aldehyde dehydrogenase family protein [Cryobacterium serini]|uniref:aldehyde dehydrogenase family protein n=1 Tax=Cryobacterium serini TaxID=1259201 RepID=UPI003B97BCA6